MRKLFLFLAAFVSTIIFLSPAKVFASNSSVYVNNFHSDIAVNQNGEVDITEQITYVFNESRHGIYRKIPISYVLDNGETQYLDIQVVDVSYKGSNSDSIYRTYTTSTDSKYLNIKIGDPDAYIQGTYVYTISYKINYLVENYSNLDKLYINIIGDSWDDPIYNTSATITMPSQIQESSCYTGVKDSTENDCTITKVNDKQISVTSSKIFSNSEFLTVVATVSSGSIVDLTEQKNNFNTTFKTSLQNNVNSDNSTLTEMNKYVVIAVVLFFVVIIVAFSTVIVMTLKKDKFGPVDMSKYMQNVVPEYNVPQGWNILRVAVFLRKNLIGNVITAEIIQLCVYGYLKITKDDKGFIIEQTGKSINDLDVPLQDFYKGLMQGKNATPVVEKRSIFDKYDINSQLFANTFSNNLSLASSRISEDLKTEGFFTENVYKEKKSGKLGWYVLALIAALIIGFIAYAITRGGTFLIMSLFIIFPILFIIIFVGIARKSYKISKAIQAQLKYSSKGEDMERYLQGLHMYIKTAEQKRIEFNNAPERYKGIFESLLPYAILFNMEKQWSAIFNITTMSWFVSAEGNDFDIVSISSSISSFASNSLYSSNGFDSSDSGGSSGGSSGGGGGGGGGGSW